MSEPPPGAYGPTDPYSYPPPSWTPPPEPPAGLRLGERLGARSFRRPVPRVGTTIAGAGALLVLVGALVWTGGYYAEGGGDRRFLGAVLFAGLTGAGYALAVSRRTGALGTAGAVLAAFGLPLTFLYLTLDPASAGSDGYPFNVDLVFLLSIAVWLVTYFVVPGLRGRALLLGAAAVSLFGYVSLKATDLGSVTHVSSSLLTGSSGADTGAVTAIGLIFGLAYYAIAAVLDARGRAGAAVALAVAGFDATVGGVLAGSGDMGQAGTGVLLVFLGIVLSAYGAYFGRRFTAWAWAAGLALGCGLVVQDVAGGSYAGNGLTLLVVGAAVIGAAYALSTALREAPEIAEGLSATG